MENEENLICELKASLFSNHQEKLYTVITFSMRNSVDFFCIMQPDSFVLDLTTEDLYFPDKCYGPAPKVCRPGVKYDKCQQSCLHDQVPGSGPTPTVSRNIDLRPPKRLTLTSVSDSLKDQCVYAIRHMDFPYDTLRPLLYNLVPYLEEERWASCIRNLHFAMLICTACNRHHSKPGCEGGVRCTRSFFSTSEKTST